MEKEIFCCLCYAMPVGSSRQDLVTEDIFDRIQTHIVTLKNEHDVSYVNTGDFNARISNLCDFLTIDSSSHVPLPDDHDEDVTLPVRSSQDKKITEYGRKLVNLCISSNFKIINSRFGMDRDIGKYTCIKKNGSSVVDYILCSQDIFSKIKKLQST